ncbi:MAG: dienelactone hydrolase family protein [Kaistella sp.]
MKIHYLVLSLSLMVFSASCKDKTVSEKENSSSSQKSSGNMTTEELKTEINGVTHRSFAAYNPNSEGKLPVVFVLPEWWGLNDYVKNRVKQLAEMGYYAVGVDYYGDQKVVNTPEEAQKLASHFYNIPVDARRMFDAAKHQVSLAEKADYSKMAVIGYCFGGAQALNMGRLSADFKGVVSFHGNLRTGIQAKNNKVRYLVLNGAADQMVSKEEIQAFKNEMDSAKINYKFIDYPNALHAFSNPDATETGKKFNLPIAYNKEADEKSWNEMKNFLAEIFK